MATALILWSVRARIIAARTGCSKMVYRGSSLTVSGSRSMASYEKEENGDKGGAWDSDLFLRRGEVAFYTLDRARELGGYLYIVIQLLEYVEVCIAVCSKHGAGGLLKFFQGVRRDGEECDMC